MTITLPPAIAKEYNQKILVISGIKFKYGHKNILAAIRACQARKIAKSEAWRKLPDEVKKFLLRPVSSLTTVEKDDRKAKMKDFKKNFEHLGQAIFYRFIEDKNGNWKIYAATEVDPETIVTSDKYGVAGADLNEDHFSLVEIDQKGNYLNKHRIDYCFYGLTANQREALEQQVAIEIVKWAKEKKKHLILEDLDFKKLKLKVGKLSASRARKLHALPYSSLRQAILSRAYKEGVKVIFVNPAFSSIIGKFKFQKIYGLSSHDAAALVIGRRYYKFSERPVSSKNYLVSGKLFSKVLRLPDWKTKEQPWGWWSKTLRLLKRAVAPLPWAQVYLRPLVSSEMEVETEITSKSKLTTKISMERPTSQEGELRQKASHGITSEILVPCCSCRSDNTLVGNNSGS